MTIEKELQEMLDDINVNLRNVVSDEEHAALLQAKATVLVGLQKYEQ